MKILATGQWISAEGVQALIDVCKKIDNHVFPVVKNGGIVVPSETSVSPNALGMEKNDAKSRQRRPETGSWQWSARRQGAAHGPRPTGQAPSVVSRDLDAFYENDLATVLAAYPNTQLWRVPHGVWLVCESALLLGLEKVAIFAIGLDFARGIVRSWGFWGGSKVGYEWIGPRHTNFPDGSICAFDPADTTWTIGESLVDLLDLYSVWAVRHLHLRLFGYWPGPQSAGDPYERLLELHANEHCGCGTSVKRYHACCYDRDIAGNRLNQALRYTKKYLGGIRRPPERIVSFVLYRRDPPTFCEI